MILWNVAVIVFAAVFIFMSLLMFIAATDDNDIDR